MLVDQPLVLVVRLDTRVVRGGVFVGGRDAASAPGVRRGDHRFGNVVHAANE